VRADRFRTLGVASLALPVVAVLIIMATQLATNPSSSATHLLIAALLAAVGWAAWRWPFAVGQLLMVGGALLAVAFVLFFHPSNITLLEIAIVELVLFMPLVVGGALFTVAGALQQRDTAADG
jgi:hypothetical protein